MAEFCVKCYNRINEEKTHCSDYILSFYPELCEGCGEYKRVIISRKPYWDNRFLFFNILYEIYLLIRELCVYLYNRKNK